MKKTIIATLIISFIIFLSIFITRLKTNTEQKDMPIGYMLENFPDLEYKKQELAEWPEIGYYVLDENLSTCSDNSKLQWNDESKSIIVQTNNAKSCNAYFSVFKCNVLINLIDDEDFSPVQGVPFTIGLDYEHVIAEGVTDDQGNVNFRVPMGYYDICYSIGDIMTNTELVITCNDDEVVTYNFMVSKSTFII